MKRIEPRNAAHVVAMLTVGVFALRCGGLTDDAHDHEHQGVHLDTGTGLLVSTRSNLQLCLQVDPALEAEAPRLAESLHSALLKMKEHPDWEAARFGTEVPEVVLGCPGGAWPKEEILPKDTLLGPGVTDAPSPYRTFVYAVAEPTAAAVLKEGIANRAIAELLRVGDHQLAEVSTALVVRATELESERFVTYWLPWSVGLVPEGGFDFDRIEVECDPKPAPDESLTKPVDDGEVKG